MRDFPEARSEPKQRPQLPSGIALAWGVAAGPTRGPKRELSIPRIVEAAVSIADEEGLGGVSMASVAKKLDFTSMSLYRYVSTKDNLLLLMQEDALGLPPEWRSKTESDEEGPQWRGRIEELYRAQVDIYVRHPWVAELVGWQLEGPNHGAPATPRSSAWLEAGLAAFAQTSLTFEERTAITLAVIGQARWHGTVLAGYAANSRNSGLNQDELSQRSNMLFEAVIEEDEFPYLRAAIDGGVFLSEADPFHFGAARLFDGIEIYLRGLDRREPDSDTL